MSAEPAVSPLRAVYLIAEMGLLFLAAPLLLYFLIFEQGYSLFKLLPWFFLVVVVLLTIDRSHSWRNTLGTAFDFKTLIRILALFAVLGGALAWYASEFYPGQFLRWARANPEQYWRVMLVYCMLSVPVQELMYRVLFFERYGPLFKSQRWAAILTSAVFFSLAHAFFPRWEGAMLISFVGGLIFASRYDETRSFWAVALEHSLYGMLIFAIGFGRFFYTGVSNL